MKKGFDFIGVGITFTCHDGNGKVLFAKRGANARDEQGKWEIAGGGLKFGETVLDGVLRELKEEFCVDPLETRFVGYHDLLREQEGQQTHWVVLDFVMRVNPDEVKIGEPDKCDAIAWHTLSELPEPIHPGVPAMLQNIKPHI